MLGNMNRAVPSVINPVASASEVFPRAKAEPNSRPKKPRRSSVATGTGLGLAYSGLGGIGGTTVRAFAAATGLSFVTAEAWALGTGPGLAPPRAAARILLVSRTTGLAATALP